MHRYSAASSLMYTRHVAMHHTVAATSMHARSFLPYKGARDVRIVGSIAR